MEPEKEECRVGNAPKAVQLLYTIWNKWLLEKTARCMFVIGGVILVSQILVVVIDTAFRHLPLPNPFHGASLEIEELQMGILAALCLAYTWYLGGHVRIELIRDKMNSRVGSIADSFAGVCGVIFCANVSWGMIHEAINNLKIGLRTDVFQISIGPFQLFFGAIFLHFTLVLLDYTCKSAYRAYRAQDKQ